MIKFRAWDKENSRMVYPSTDDVYFVLTDDGINILDMSVEPFDDVFPRLDAVLMQSTGLKDKNGVEIFEGDVFESGYARYVVFWQKDDVRFALKFIHDFEDSYYLDMRNIESMDLIGNIHENPELAS